MTNSEIVRRFEDEFKNKGNFDIVDELMAPNFVHHLPSPNLPPGRDGMKAVGQFVTGAIADISVTVQFVASEGDLVADRVAAHGRRKDSGEPISWTENHFYLVRNGKIAELWPEGGPNL
jgi:ketosteroid isomerase-like protein